ncbi:P2 family phage major capsid protein [Yersinia enterocolitica]|uniref:P2 family phage major capsid protein n=1 Tax=Yersinia enterocolitica TaxID=630 RepID=UPI001C608D6C|nr:P2 family phage major capsid protein [Yersinia enterocolitica]MBW5875988.1 P2 family phage major capsid protein [Yersinia enterocolitica]
MFFNINDLKDKAENVLKSINISSPAERMNESAINTALAERELYARINAYTQKNPFAHFISPSNWLSAQIKYLSVNPLQNAINLIGDLHLSTGRAEKGRFTRSMDIKGSPIECYEMDSCEYLDWINLVVMTNAVNDDKNRDALLGILCSYLTSKIYLDDLRIGFNGKSAATLTNPDTNPNGEDVAPGWHEIARNANNGKQIISNAITLGKGGDFPGVDALVQHLIKTRIAAPWQNDPRLVVMVGSELAAAERLRLFNTANGAGDTEAANAWGSTIAGHFAFVPPFMPGKRLVVTMLPNLLINIIEGSYRTEFNMNKNTKRLNMRAWRHQGYGLADVSMYAAVDESAITLNS